MTSRTEPSTAPDEAGKWFWNFLKSELAPYPGRAWVVGRITIAATVVMLLVMTFRLPSGFQGAIFTLLLSREDPSATLRAGVRTVVAFALGTGYTVLGVMLLVGEPLTHFLWVMISLLLAFYLIRIVTDYGAAVAFGFMVAGAIPLWDEAALNVNTRVENTLWLAFVVLVGSAVTIAVEYAFRRVHPITALTQGVESRLQAVEDLLRNVAAGLPLAPKVDKEISLHANAGTSRLRRHLARSSYSPHFVAQMNAAVALLGRLVDLAASLRIFHTSQQISLSTADRDRCLRLADQISRLRSDFMRRELTRGIEVPVQDEPSNVPFLPAMERTVALLPQAFSGSASLEDVFIPAPMDEEVRQRWLVPDAFSNPAHLQFALRGLLAALACYVVYSALDWRGLSTSVATCIITALSTIGSSRQKQFLRLLGAIIGGFFFGMGSQIFILPHLDSIAGFALLFAAVTAISAWIATATPRLSYLGVQLALAFYIINLQEFAIQTSLAVARDRVFGVILGLLSMWLVFDRLWVRNALDEMQAAFARNLQMFAEITEQLLLEDRNEAVRRIRRLRDQINAGFELVRAQSDAILFEFGASRERKLKIRDNIRRWQPLLRTLLQVQLTLGQYRLQRPLDALPQPVASAQTAFATDVARMTRTMAEEVSGNTSTAAPDILSSAARLEKEIRTWYEERGLPIPPDSADVIGLTRNLASILASLHKDIHSTFANTQQTADQLPEAMLGGAEA